VGAQHDHNIGTDDGTMVVSLDSMDSFEFEDSSSPAAAAGDQQTSLRSRGRSAAVSISSSEHQSPSSSGGGALRNARGHRTAPSLGSGSSDVIAEEEGGAEKNKDNESGNPTADPLPSDRPIVLAVDDEDTVLPSATLNFASSTEALMKGDGEEELEVDEPDELVVDEDEWSEEAQSALSTPSTRARSSQIDLTPMLPTPSPEQLPAAALTGTAAAAAARGGLRSNPSKERESLHHRRTVSSASTSSTGSNGPSTSAGGEAGAAVAGAAAASVLNPSHMVRQRLHDSSIITPQLQLGHPSNTVLSTAASGASMLAVFEILLHFDTFKNIDLFRQGLYFLRAHCFTLGGVRIDPMAGKNAASSSGGGGPGSSGSSTSAAATGGGATASTGSSVLSSSRDVASLDPISPHCEQDLSSLPRDMDEAAALQAQILAWEAAVHDLNNPVQKKKVEESPAPGSANGGAVAWRLPVACNCASTRLPCPTTCSKIPPTASPMEIAVSVARFRPVAPCSPSRTRPCTLPRSKPLRPTSIRAPFASSTANKKSC
jgi:hypothetical protein